jgi:hypothetical protein
MHFPLAVPWNLWSLWLRCFGQTWGKAGTGSTGWQPRTPTACLQIGCAPVGQGIEETAGLVCVCVWLARDVWAGGWVSWFV